MITETTVYQAYVNNAARSEYLVYTDWNKRAHVIIDIRPAGAKTWNREEHTIPDLPENQLTFEVICSDGVLDRVDGDELLGTFHQKE